MSGPLILKGRSLVLREITEGDLPILYEWRNDLRFQKFCTQRINTVTLEEFRSEIMQDFRVDRDIQLLILKGDEPIGTIFNYDLNKQHGYTFITLFSASRVEFKGYGPEAICLFMRYLFVTYDLYKIYAEVYEYNTNTLSVLKKERSGFVEEGRFRGHRLYEGKRYSLLRFAYFRERLPELEAFLKRKFRSPSISFP